MSKSSASVANSSKSNQGAKRPVAINQRFTSPGAICGLCDKEAQVLVRMKKLFGDGTVLSCSECLGELTGRRGADSA